MRVTSQEQKQNFFNNVSGRSPPMRDPPETATSSKYGFQPDGVQFARQKFFAPDVPSEGHDDLVDALSGWSLGDSVGPKKSVEKSTVRHIWQGVALFIALVFWNQALKYPSEHTKNIILVIMFGCLCIGARTILDNTIYTVEDKQSVENALAYTVGTCLGGLEFSAACYGLAQILAGDCENCGPLGTILIGGMMVHEMWVASFG
jgi:hypothetical protein